MDTGGLFLLIWVGGFAQCEIKEVKFGYGGYIYTYLYLLNSELSSFIDPDAFGTARLWGGNYVSD